jgi:hypothetical protein
MPHVVVRVSLMLLLAAGCLGDPTRPAPPDGEAKDPTLVGWWKLDESAGVQAADSSGNGNTGTLTLGITWVDGHAPGHRAIDIDGNDEHDVDLGNPPVLQIAGSFTLAAWVNARSFHLGTMQDDAIVSRDDGLHGAVGWSLKGTEDCSAGEHFAIQVGINGTNYVERCTTMTPAYGFWYHVVGVYDAPQQTLDTYINGALDDDMLFPPSAAVPQKQSVPSSAVHVQIGNTEPLTSDSGGTQTWDGQLDDIRIYNRALDSAEIAALASH